MSDGSHVLDHATFPKSTRASLSKQLDMIRASAQETTRQVAQLRLELGLDCGETYHQLGCNHPVPPLETLSYVSPAAPFYEQWKALRD